jgi:pseudaminic acid cytidylyltransferase
MIARSIQAASKSGCFDRIIVSTDDDEIAETAEHHGAEIPFRRSTALADDHTPTVPVIAGAIARRNIRGQTPVCCLYATAPFVRSDDLRAGLARLDDTDAPFVLSVTTYAFPIQRALRQSDAGEVDMFDPAQTEARSQDLEEAWPDAGQFYWGRAKSWVSNQGIVGKGKQGLALRRHLVQDIDTDEDWLRAEWMMHSLAAGAPV